MGNISTIGFHCIAWIPLAALVGTLVFGTYKERNLAKDKKHTTIMGALAVAAVIWTIVFVALLVAYKSQWDLRDLASDDQKYFRATETGKTTFVTIPSDVAYEAAGKLDKTERGKAIEQIKKTGGPDTTGAEYVKFLAALNTAYGTKGTITSTTAATAATSAMYW